MASEHDEHTVDLHALAIQQQALDEWSAGRRPRLSLYVRRYPAYAGMLANLFATLTPEAQPEETEMPTESFPERLWKGAGVGRALSDIFGASPSDVDQRLPRVAEERATYGFGAPVEPPDPDHR